VNIEEVINLQIGKKTGVLGNQRNRVLGGVIQKVFRGRSVVDQDTPSRWGVFVGE